MCEKVVYSIYKGKVEGVSLEAMPSCKFSFSQNSVKI